MEVSNMIWWYVYALGFAGMFVSVLSMEHPDPTINATGPRILGGFFAAVLWPAVVAGWILQRIRG